MNDSTDILAADIGNSHTTVAQMRGLEVLNHFDLSSHAPVEEVANTLKAKLSADLLPLPLVIASVNPRGLTALEQAWQAVGGGDANVLGREIDIPIPNRVVPPDGAGKDRLCNALAATQRAGPDVVVIDFGTAITFDVVKDGAYCGGSISPGIGLAMQALHQRTAMLPLVNPQGKPGVVGNTTPDAINAGVYYGYIGLVSNILKETLATYKQRPTVFATGGYGAYLTPEIVGIDEVVPHLTHEGIALAWQARNA